MTSTWGPFRWIDAEVADARSKGTTWSFEFDDSRTGSGGYYVQVRARDTAGNVGTVTGVRFDVG